MTKIKVLDTNGNKIKEIETKIFDSDIREDIVQKIAEIERLNEKQEYAPFWLAGQQTSASGAVKHTRHVWKSDRGKGLARIPKKQMARSGDRFTWVGAVIPGTRGGRRAHPPKLGKSEKKINRKERKIGLLSALAMTKSLEMIKKRYKTLSNGKLKLDLPLVIESKMLGLKSKEFIGAISKITGEASKIAFQEKNVRAGRGKSRGRKYKKNSGALLVIGNKENKKVKGIDTLKANELKIKDIAKNGARIVIFTEESIKNLDEKLGEEK